MMWHDRVKERQTERREKMLSFHSTDLPIQRDISLRGNKFIIIQFINVNDNYKVYQYDIHVYKNS